ncbi:hypothetical protein [Marinospirillum sp.]|uniref:hypothetical protein n=1 Tax=Marinospirillum sp. TaxID=2183934 RepID=UPI002870368C|nr:hypothetical protein [Marinospirillum sp.]MDR9469273.1 hypothetical protein [Marinospirillum sp.]
MDHLLSLYQVRKEAPLWWFNKSSDLRASAGTLWLGMSSDERSKEITESLHLGDGFSIPIAVRPVYQMLCGMSLELIFKAVVVARGYKPNHVHDLPSLAERAALAYSEEERGILAVFTESIIWEGRYPVPKKEEIMDKACQLRSAHCFTPHGKSGMFKKPNDALSWASFNSIWGRASEAFWNERS